MTGLFALLCPGQEQADIARHAAGKIHDASCQVESKRPQFRLPAQIDLRGLAPQRLWPIGFGSIYRPSTVAAELAGMPRTTFNAIVQNGVTHLFCHDSGEAPGLEKAMPHASNDQQPAYVRDHLPPHAQDIHREASNHTWQKFENSASHEEIAHRIACAAVKRRYEKRDGIWRPISAGAAIG